MKRIARIGEIAEHRRKVLKTGTAALPTEFNPPLCLSIWILWRFWHFCVPIGLIPVLWSHS